jgi:hypothetical protein
VIVRSTVVASSRTATRDRTGRFRVLAAAVGHSSRSGCIARVC